jgi:hypothetical protein
MPEDSDILFELELHVHTVLTWKNSEEFLGWGLPPNA